jgi:hypothetical protein
MILFMVVVAVLAGLGGRALLTDFHLQQAAREAGSIVASVTRQAPGELRAAFARQPDPGTDLRGAIAAIGAVLDEAVADRRFRKVKVYDESGVLRYSTDREEIGTVERGEAINAALGGKGNVAALKETAEGPLYELYVYLPPSAGAPAMVVELYEFRRYPDRRVALGVDPGHCRATVHPCHHHPVSRPYGFPRPARA